MASVTEQLAEWIVKVGYEDVPEVGVHRVKERVIDSLGVQFAGMSVSTGKIISEWVLAQGGRPDSTVIGAGVKTTAAYATLANTTAGHALEFDDIATFSGHYANPLTAATLALGEKLGASGREVILAWMVGWEVICQTAKPCMDGARNTLLWRGWFNQGFQPALGIAASSAKLLGLDVTQTRMALANAAAAMGGILKNRGTDTKSFTAGNAAMHGVIAGELMALGFTGNEEILDGEDGVARMLGLEVGDPEKILAGLGTWDMATRSSTIRLHASCGAGHWSQDALQQIVRRHPTDPEDIESITAYVPAFLMPMMPYHQPETGLEGKYSIEYDLAAVALDGRAGLHQYSDEAVRRPAARRLMDRVRYVPMEVDTSSRAGLNSRVVLKLTNGEEFDETVGSSHGTPEDPLSEAEILGKFHECAAAATSAEQRERVLDLCWRLDSLDDVAQFGAVMSTSST